MLFKNKLNQKENSIKTKVCFKCEKEKPLSEFYKHDQMADGHLNKCKECAKQDVSQHREENLDEIQACDRKRGNLPYRITARKIYQKTEAGRLAGNRAKKKWIEKHPAERAAYSILNFAIKSGKIKRMPCEKCGTIKHVHGHHDDYTKPLDVHWLCPECHSRHHKELRKENRYSILEK